MFEILWACLLVFVVLVLVSLFTNRLGECPDWAKPNKCSSSRRPRREIIQDSVLTDHDPNNNVMITNMIVLDTSEATAIGGAEDPHYWMDCIMQQFERVVERYPRLKQRIVFDDKHAYWEEVPDYCVRTAGNVSVLAGVRSRLDVMRFLERKYCVTDETLLKRLPPWHFILLPDSSSGDPSKPHRRTVFFSFHHCYFDGMNVLRFMLEALSGKLLFGRSDGSKSEPSPRTPPPQIEYNGARALERYDAFLTNFRKPALYKTLLLAITPPLVMPALHGAGDHDHDDRSSSSRHYWEDESTSRTTFKAWQSCLFKSNVSESSTTCMQFNEPNYLWHHNPPSSSSSTTDDIIHLSNLKRAAKRLKVSLNDLVLLCLYDALNRVAAPASSTGIPVNFRVTLALRNKLDFTNNADGTIRMTNRSSALRIRMQHALRGGGGGGTGGYDGPRDRRRRLMDIRTQFRRGIWEANLIVSVESNFTVPYHCIQPFKEALPGCGPVLAQLPHIQTSQSYPPNELRVLVSNVPGPTSTVHLAGSAIEEIFFFAGACQDEPLKVNILSYNGQLHLSMNAYARVWKLDLDIVGHYLVRELQMYS